MISTLTPCCYSTITANTINATARTSVWALSSTNRESQGIMKPSPAALVYNGPGAGTRSVLSAIQSLRDALSPAITVETIGTESLLHKNWQERCVLLVLPGGADLPYCKHLNGRGTELIRSFVNAGGSYLGLCAGAYFACSRVEFEVGDDTLQVVGDRELSFFPGIARGSVFKGFEYEGEGGSVAAHLQIEDNGTTLTSCMDYVNGGPQFLSAPDGSLLTPETLLSLNKYHDIRVLARYVDISQSAASLLCRVGQGKAVLCASHPELDPSWLGRPAGAGRSDYVASLHDGNGGELSAAASTKKRTMTAAEQYIENLRLKLEGNQQQRWEYWRLLLSSAGLDEYLI